MGKITTTTTPQLDASAKSVWLILRISYRCHCGRTGNSSHLASHTGRLQQGVVEGTKLFKINVPYTSHNSQTIVRKNKQHHGSRMNISHSDALFWGHNS
jgi:hypothetical protein